jgi:hypothetical protein
VDPARWVAQGNYLLSYIVAVGWISYGLWRGLPLAEECLGYRGGIAIPAWMDWAIAETLLLALFALRGRADASKMKLLFIAAGLWGLALTLGEPIVRHGWPSSWDDSLVTLDRLLGWYACGSVLLCGCLGMGRS